MKLLFKQTTHKKTRHRRRTHCKTTLLLHTAVPTPLHATLHVDSIRSTQSSPDFPTSLRPYNYHYSHLTRQQQRPISFWSKAKNIKDNVKPTPSVLDEQPPVQSPSLFNIIHTAKSSTNQLVQNTMQKSSQLVSDTIQQSSQLVNDTVKQSAQIVTETVVQSTSLAQEKLQQTHKIVNETVKQSTQIINETVKQSTQLVTETASYAKTAAHEKIKETQQIMQENVENSKKIVHENIEKSASTIYGTAQKSQQLVHSNYTKTSNRLQKEMDALQNNIKTNAQNINKNVELSIKSTTEVVENTVINPIVKTLTTTTTQIRPLITQLPFISSPPKTATISSDTTDSSTSENISIDVTSIPLLSTLSKVIPIKSKHPLTMQKITESGNILPSTNAELTPLKLTTTETPTIPSTPIQRKFQQFFLTNTNIIKRTFNKNIINTLISKTTTILPIQSLQAAMYATLMLFHRHNKLQQNVFNLPSLISQDLGSNLQLLTALGSIAQKHSTYNYLNFFRSEDWVAKSTAIFLQRYLYFAISTYRKNIIDVEDMASKSGFDTKLLYSSNYFSHNEFILDQDNEKSATQVKLHKIKKSDYQKNPEKSQKLLATEKSKKKTLPKIPLSIPTPPSAGALAMTKQQYEQLSRNHQDYENPHIISSIDEPQTDITEDDLNNPERFNLSLETPTFNIFEDKTNGNIVITIRGTSNIDDVVVDIISWPLQFKDSYVHNGMLTMSQRLLPSILHSLRNVLIQKYLKSNVPLNKDFELAEDQRSNESEINNNPNYHDEKEEDYDINLNFINSLDTFKDKPIPRVIFVGHSLGGGLAALMTMLFHAHKPEDFDENCAALNELIELDQIDKSGKKRTRFYKNKYEDVLTLAQSPHFIKKYYHDDFHIEVPDIPDNDKKVDKSTKPTLANLKKLLKKSKNFNYELLHIIKPECINYASPALTSPELSEKTKGYIISVLNGDDPVPRLSEYSANVLICDVFYEALTRQRYEDSLIAAKNAEENKTLQTSPDNAGNALRNATTPIQLHGTSMNPFIHKRAQLNVHSKPLTTASVQAHVNQTIYSKNGGKDVFSTSHATELMFKSLSFGYSAAQRYKYFYNPALLVKNELKSIAKSQAHAFGVEYVLNSIETEVKGAYDATAARSSFVSQMHNKGQYQWDEILDQDADLAPEELVLDQHQVHQLPYIGDYLHKVKTDNPIELNESETWNMVLDNSYTDESRNSHNTIASPCVEIENTADKLSNPLESPHQISRQQTEHLKSSSLKKSISIDSLNSEFNEFFTNYKAILQNNIPSSLYNALSSLSTTISSQESQEKKTIPSSDDIKHTALTVSIPQPPQETTKFKQFDEILPKPLHNKVFSSADQYIHSNKQKLFPLDYQHIASFDDHESLKKNDVVNDSTQHKALAYFKLDEFNNAMARMDVPGNIFYLKRILKDVYVNVHQPIVEQYGDLYQNDDKLPKNTSILTTIASKVLIQLNSNKKTIKDNNIEVDPNDTHLWKISPITGLLNIKGQSINQFNLTPTADTTHFKHPPRLWYGQMDDQHINPPHPRTHFTRQNNELITALLSARDSPALPYIPPSPPSLNATGNCSIDAIHQDENIFHKRNDLMIQVLNTVTESIAASILPDTLSPTEKSKKKSDEKIDSNSFDIISNYISSKGINDHLTALRQLKQQEYVRVMTHRNSEEFSHMLLSEHMAFDHFSRSYITAFEDALGLDSITTSTTATPSLSAQKEKCAGGKESSAEKCVDEHPDSDQLQDFSHYLNTIATNGAAGTTTNESGQTTSSFTLSQINTLYTPANNIMTAATSALSGIMNFKLSVENIKLNKTTSQESLSLSLSDDNVRPQQVDGVKDGEKLSRNADIQKYLE